MKTLKYALLDQRSGLYVRRMRLTSDQIQNLSYTAPVGTDGIIDVKQGMGAAAAQTYYSYAEVAMARDALIALGEKIAIIEK